MARIGMQGGVGPSAREAQRRRCLPHRTHPACVRLWAQASRVSAAVVTTKEQTMNSFGRLWPAGSWSPRSRSVPRSRGTSVAAGQEAVKTPSVQARTGYAVTRRAQLPRGSGRCIKQGRNSHAFRAGTPWRPRDARPPRRDKAALAARPATAGQGTRGGQRNKTKIRRFASLSPKEPARLRQLPFPFRARLLARSQHDQRKVGCTTCHSVHAPVGDKQIRRRTRPGCASPAPDDRQQAAQVQPHAGA